MFCFPFISTYQISLIIYLKIIKFSLSSQQINLELWNAIWILLVLQPVWRKTKSLKGFLSIFNLTSSPDMRSDKRLDKHMKSYLAFKPQYIKICSNSSHFISFDSKVFYIFFKNWVNHCNGKYTKRSYFWGI